MSDEMKRWSLEAARRGFSDWYPEDHPVGKPTWANLQYRWVRDDGRVQAALTNEAGELLPPNNEQLDPT